MNIEEFIKEFANQFDEVPADTFTIDTNFKDNEEWGSMTALSLIAMVDDNYNVRLTGEEIKNAITVKDIFDTVAAKINT